MNESETKDKSYHKSIVCHSKAIVSIKYSLKGNYLATASADKSSCILDNNLDKKAVIEGEHTQGLNDCGWIEEDYIVTASDDKKVKIYDIQAKQNIREFNDHQSFVYCLSVNVRNSCIASGGYDGTIHIFDTKLAYSVINFNAHSDYVSSIDYHNNGIHIVTGSKDGIVRIWDTRILSHCVVTITNPNQPPISSVKYSENGKYLLISSLDSTHRLYDVNDYSDISLLKNYIGHENKKYTVTSTFYTDKNNKNYIVSGSDESNVYCWDLSKGSIKESLQGHNDIVYSVTSHPLVSSIASASGDNSVKLWDLLT